MAFPRLAAAADALIIRSTSPTSPGVSHLPSSRVRTASYDYLQRDNVHDRQGFLLLRLRGAEHRASGQDPAGDQRRLQTHSLGGVKSALKRNFIEEVPSTIIHRFIHATLLLVARAINSWNSMCLFSQRENAFHEIVSAK